MSAVSPLFAALAFITLITLGACATGHQAMSGAVIMKVSDTEAHVCFFEKEAPVGTRVQMFRHMCVSAAGKRYECDKQPVAIGTIEQTMGGHYAMVRFPQGTKIEDGYTVEPIP